jgi:hypothetical protein
VLLVVELGKVDDSHPPNLLVSGAVSFHLFTLAWNLRGVLRFLLHVALYGGVILTGLAAVSLLYG